MPGAPHSIDATHDPALRAFLPSANKEGTDFPIQNLPFGVFCPSAGEAPRGGVAIGDQVLDLAAAVEAGLFEGAAAQAARAATGPSLNPLMALGQEAAGALRARLSALLAEGSPHQARVAPLLRPIAAVEMLLPASIGDYTDFYTSYDHCIRGGRVTRPENPLPPAFHWLPIAYHGRASSVRVSGGAVRRPLGIRRGAEGGVSFGPSEALDFELEFGAFIGPGNALGEPMPLSRARRSLFGFVLLNDWSARDIQRFESQPLGPFLSKSLSTTISPWIVTAAALAPFRCAPAPRPEGAPAPLPHLTDAEEEAAGQMDVRLEAWLRPRGAARAERIVATRLGHLTWTPAQMLTHHASNGCNLKPGDLLGSGTVSGPRDEERACLWEISLGGVPLRFEDGSERRYLEDGDEVILRGRAERPGFVPIGFGECRAVVAPAPDWPEA